MQISNNLSTSNYLSRENIAREMGFKFKDINEILSNDMGHGMTFTKYARLDDKERAREYDRYDHSLTGFVKGEGEPRVSILGKLMGYDDSFSKDEIDELKKFIDDSGALGLERNPAFEPKGIFKDPLNSKKLSVDDFIDQFANKKILSFIAFGGSKTAELLDSDMSIDELKGKWAKFALKKRFGLELDEELAKETINSINDLETQNEEDKKEKKFTPIQVTKKSHTYKLEADERFKELYKFIKSEFDSGKSMFEILEKVVKLKVDKTA
ncbi:hypothetical protein [Campylobacter concisus]|uniref:hypothetical protein n=1 Tax=Campylobacter concisus TaxID=199 RepID=UPI00130D8A8D|nr:hypothetical protein [Campylobacter concisus]